MKYYTIILLTLFVFSGMTSCQKEQPEPYQSLVFHSLMPSSSSFQAGTSVGITADVSGTQVQYYWSYNSGEIEGNGDYVTYTNDEVGAHMILCSVVDSQGEVDQKEVWLTVQ